MDTRTGHLYPTRDAALTAGASPDDVVEIAGTVQAVRRAARAVQLRRAADRRHAAARAARRARRRNRAR